MSHRPALHFVGFKDDRVWNAIRIWGRPDFWHRNWDYRAKAEIVPGDVAIFAKGTYDDEPKKISHDDSQLF
jgi:hypothetical protein